MKRSESLLKRRIREYIKLNIELTDKECIVMADSGQIEQVLVNLVTNAKDTMPNGGSLVISTMVILMFIVNKAMARRSKYISQ
ncbi:MAG TPA: hypothetical protein ACFYEC_07165 [Candidatus Brocadiaceae bacterium]